ncbi:peptide/nickel transport system permease protein [Proteiniborus ethanoligenes]|uniref:Peptide/nickel transport system permease protein n=1 Tax=Proteiniborus ethanoligenes TaxID=415015 RepID=A0A1H3MMN2_9FIRM|nr:ABC transporter permease [Proteiniborus ethanoligenes]SDY77714.1 peptide/nickel transport system permease protein [Proteiniborus ethanoligenes]
MLKYIGRRLLHLIPVLIIISIVIFTILEQMPGDPVNAYLGEGSAVTVEQQQMMRAKLGLDQPAPVRYLKWLGRTLTGDFGTSLKYRKPVNEVIGTFIWNSFLLNVVAMTLAFAIAIPVGIRSAVKKYGLFDNFWTVFSLTGVSMPSFFFALILIFFIAVPIKWIPLNGMRTVLLAAKGYPSKWAEILDVLKHMILPVTVLTISSLASLTRYVRNSVVEVINQDYIRTARSKGLTEKVVIYKHAFRNALLPIVTLLGMYLPGLFGGSILLETVFIWPGIGNILFKSIGDRDFSMLMAANVFYAILTVTGNLLADVSYALVDPRVKVE